MIIITSYNGYVDSIAKEIVDSWFSQLNLSCNLKKYSVGNTALSNIGCYMKVNDPTYSSIYEYNKSGEAMGDGFSLPDSRGEKTAFLLSFQEVKNYIAYKCEFGGFSSGEAYNNYKQIRELTSGLIQKLNSELKSKSSGIWPFKKVETISENYINTCWLRTPGDELAKGTCFGGMGIGGSVVSRRLESSCYIRPAIWVKSSIFGDPEPQEEIPLESPLTQSGSFNVSVQRNTHVNSEPMTIEQILFPLDSLVGLGDLKGLVRGLILNVQQNELDLKVGIVYPKPSLHMIITGNPGTGKTTVAQKLGEVYYNAGLISQNKFVKVERADLVGKYIGHTEDIVKNKLNEAEGGILFIDEAYNKLVGTLRTQTRNFLVTN